MIREDVFKIISDTLNIPLEEVNEDSSPKTLANWDSLHHINLILALEEKFGIEFNEKQIAEILNVKAILLAVEELKRSK